MITITISRRGQNRPRTRDKAPTLASLYADLLDRLQRAAIEVNGGTQDDYDPAKHPHATAGTSQGGQFTATPGGPAGEKPTTIKAKAAKSGMHELLSSGHAFSKKELMDIAGVKSEKLFADYIAMIKNPKYAGGAGALKIQKLPNGSYQVQMPDGTPAPALPGLAEAVTPAKIELPAAIAEHLPPTPPIVEPAAPLVEKDKAQADQHYANAMTDAQLTLSDAMQLAASSPNILTLALGVVKDYKDDKAKAMAKWKEHVTGEAVKPKLDPVKHAADHALAEELASEYGKAASVNAYPAILQKALAQWKTNTMLEKQGKFPAAKAAAKPKPIAQVAATLVSKPVKAIDYASLVPKDFKGISEDDIVNDVFRDKIESLKSTLEMLGGTAVANKTSVNDRLVARLANAPNFQAIKKKGNFDATGQQSLEGKLISAWASSSGDGHALSCAMQLAVQAAFNQPEKDLTKQQLKHIKDSSEDYTWKQAGMSLNTDMGTPENVETFKKGMQEFVHAQYHETQDFFAQHGIEHVFLSRGMKTQKGLAPPAEGAQPLKLQPASSFSANYATARSFAGSGGAVFLTKVPVSQVLSTYLTGYGCSSEHEVVVLGHKTLEAYSLSTGDSGYSAISINEVLKQKIQSAKVTA